jgi:dihydrofolate synthase/folylpolyglutamate synthase
MHVRPGEPTQPPTAAAPREARGATQLLPPTAALPPPDEVAGDPAYRAALDYLYGLSPLPRPPAAIRADRPRKLVRMRQLLAAWGNPQHCYPCVLIAGTKGKGSTAAMLAAVLHASGLHVGRYTQPHLVSYRERVWVDGAYIPEHAVAALTAEVRPLVEALHVRRPDLGTFTTFEVGTALALTHFARERVDLAVVEVGVGGAHDATNVLDPLVSIITPISADHLDTIGPTLADVATEKAGVMRPGRPAVLAAQAPAVAAVLAAAATATGAQPRPVAAAWRWDPAGEPAGQAPFRIVGPFGCLEPLTLALLGRHQRDNALLAVAAAQALAEHDFPVTAEAIRRGLAAVAWPGRIQLVSGAPPVVVDGAHNAASAAVLRATLAESWPGRPWSLVLGCTAGKDVDAIVAELASPAGVVVATQTRHLRAVPAATIAAAAARVGRPTRIAPDVATALGEASRLTPPEGLVVVAGSLFLAGEALASLASDAIRP